MKGIFFLLLPCYSSPFKIKKNLVNYAWKDIRFSKRPGTLGHLKNYPKFTTCKTAVMIRLRHKEIVISPKFSILIPTWNNLLYLQLCLKSLARNSGYQHQIIVHVNEGTDGTLDWVKSHGYSYTYSPENIGVCWSMNAMRSLAEADYLVFMNDDMYACPGWDTALVEEIESLPDHFFYLSSTLIQPRKFWCNSVISPASFGEDIDSFDEEALLASYMDLPHHDWKGSTWPPTVVHRDLWDLIGGYSVEFSPGLYSDPDFSAKLYLAGVRYFKGVNKSRVYHFEARSTGRVKKNKGSRQFLFKWGLTSATFTMHILRRGTPFGQREAEHHKLLPALWKGRLKKIYSVFLAMGQTKKIWEE
jgi:glycosyltransferase involved in cell wall biosynthesis